jgi:5-oxoprolinase (ATP-hydrolysing)
LDFEVVKGKFEELRGQINDGRTIEEIAEGFIRIAVGNMANAIKHISVQRGHDVTAYTLCCFGGAAGQHACLVADALAMTRVFIHPHAGVLSAYGMGLADQVAMRERSVEAPLSDLAALRKLADELAAAAQGDLAAQGVSGGKLVRHVHVKYEGTDTALPVALGSVAEMTAQFEDAYRKQFSFLMPGRALVAEALSVEAIAEGVPIAEEVVAGTTPAGPVQQVRMFTGGALARGAALSPRRPRGRASGSTARRSSPRRTRPRSSSRSGAPGSRR